MISGILNSAVSALSLNAQRVGASADNIANISTTGYKTTRVDAATLTTRQSTTTAYSAGGVQSRPRAQADVQGLLAADPRATSMAISGDGYFAVRRGAETLYTRDGGFAPDNRGDLVNGAGDTLLGADGNPVNLNAVNGTAAATTTATIGANLPADADVGQGFTVNIPATDSLGRARTVEATFTARADGGYQLSIPGATQGDAAGPAYDVNLTFGGDGRLSSAPPPAAHLPGTDGAADLTVALNLDGLTRFAGDFTLNSGQADGAAYGTANGFSVAPDGTLSATFDNGETRAVASVPVTTFANPGGLDAAGAGAYRATDASGAPTTNPGGAGGAGTVQGGALELSATDPGQEFANMIMAQSAYSAGLKTVAAADDMSRQLLDATG